MTKPATKTEPATRIYVPPDINYNYVSERRGGYVVRKTCIQHDMRGQPCVLAITADGWESLQEALVGGRAYLRAVPVTLLREFESDLMVVSSAGLVHNMTIFEAHPMPGPDGEVRE